MDLPLVLQGALFTGTALLIVVVGIWWLYFSSNKNQISEKKTPSLKFAVPVSSSLGLAAVLFITGAFWDTSMHILTGAVPGVDDFFWPPHIVLYSAFVISFLIGVVGLVVIAKDGRQQGINDPRLWVRRNPFIGAVVLASFYGFASVPGDAIWHELFGIDLTPWSPPHLMLTTSIVALMISAIGLLIQARQSSKSPQRVNFAVIFLLGMMLNFAYFNGTVEYEISPILTPIVLARPDWAYPVVAGIIPLIILLLAKWLTKVRWAATLTALAFYFVRYLVHYGLSLTEQVVPATPAIFLLGAVLLDAVNWEKIANPFTAPLFASLAYSIGYALVSFPIMAQQTRLQLEFDTSFVSLTFIIFLIIAWLLYPLIHKISRALLGGQASSA